MVRKPHLTGTGVYITGGAAIWATLVAMIIDWLNPWPGILLIVLLWCGTVALTYRIDTPTPDHPTDPPDTARDDAEHHLDLDLAWNSPADGLLWADYIRAWIWRHDHPALSRGKTLTDITFEHPWETAAETAAETAGKTIEKTPPKNPGKNPGKNAQKNPGKKRRENAGENAGKNPGENCGQKYPEDSYECFCGQCPEKSAEKSDDITATELREKIAEELGWKTGDKFYLGLLNGPAGKNPVAFQPGGPVGKPGPYISGKTPAKIDNNRSTCPWCERDIIVTGTNLIGTHPREPDSTIPCPGSGTPVRTPR
jgi:hypothetical protein